MKQDNGALTGRNAGDHLANERTFFAWVRTNIGIMGFGFVVVKFSLFIKQISTATGTKQNVTNNGYSHLIGIFLIAFGGLIIVLSYLRYKNTNNGDYYHSTSFVKIITILIFIISVFLLLHLIAAA